MKSTALAQQVVWLQIQGVINSALDISMHSFGHIIIWLFPPDMAPWLKWSVSLTQILPFDVNQQFPLEKGLQENNVLNF